MSRKNRQRMKMLKALCDACKDSTIGYVNISEIGKWLGFDYQTTKDIFEYLEAKGLLDYHHKDGTEEFVCLTSSGIDEVEKSRRFYNHWLFKFVLIPLLVFLVGGILLNLILNSKNRRTGEISREAPEEEMKAEVVVLEKSTSTVTAQPEVNLKQENKN